MTEVVVPMAPLALEIAGLKMSAMFDDAPMTHAF